MSVARAPAAPDDSAEVLALAERHCDGVLDTREAVRLEELIVGEVRLAQLFCEYCDLHATLNSRLRTQEGRPKPRPFARKPTPRRRAGHRGLFLATAASLFAAVAGLSWFAGGSRPEPLGRIAGLSTDARFLEERFEPGRLCYPGDKIDLLSGWATLDFGAGVKLSVQGPASVMPVSGARVRLESGRLAARVPPAAVGFEVVTPDVVVVDLGTEFLVERTVDAGTSVHVREGRVVATPRASEGDAENSLELTAGRSGIFDLGLSTGREIAPPGGLEEWFAKQRRVAGTFARFEGVVRTLPFVPTDLTAGRQQTTNYVAIVPERERVVVASDLRLPTPDGPVTIPAGTVLGSYLLHYEATGSTSVPAVGVVRFDRPVAAIIADTASLEATDAQFGLPGTAYPHDAVRGVEINEDRVGGLSTRDGVSFHFDLSPPLPLDQVRVLVRSGGAGT